MWSKIQVVPCEGIERSQVIGNVRSKASLLASLINHIPRLCGGSKNNMLFPDAIFVYIKDQRIQKDQASLSNL